ncbi:hypothetical protein MVEN_01866300 [Mycena venus]|uniref:SMP-30/Gluconolactonase/LRE-like region domain-containing protein n=1 Tax=Mycena venus TaxID=2733690 RepID=A0A8H6XIT7_9AGAR|nr:hypothetical protein MVEN_01866300 [Mycena venus]
MRMRIALPPDQVKKKSCNSDSDTPKSLFRMMSFLPFLIHSALISLPLAHAITNPSLLRATASALPIQLLLQSPVSFENVAVHASSELLLTSFGSPTLYTFVPKTMNGTLVELHTFPNATSLTGIAEYRPGFFALIASTVNPTTRHMVPGSVVLWSVDFTSPTSNPSVQKLADIPTSEGANGLTVVPGHPDILLAADSYSGSIWQIDIRTGRASVAIEDEVFLPGAPAPAVGINGIHARDDEYVYFTNSQKGVFGRLAVRVDGVGNVSASHPVETLVSIQSVETEQQLPDDFAVDCEGRAWVTVRPGALALLEPPAKGNGSWTQTTVLGNAAGSDADIVEPASVTFGRGSAAEERTLYVVTAAGQIFAAEI